MTTISYRFRVRRRTAASWTSLNEVLLDSEIGIESDTGTADGKRRFKIGDGVTAWNDLPYFTSGGGAWGDITGTLSDQPDLQAALDAKADASGIALAGRVSTYGALPTTGLAPGDSYLVDADNLVYVWNGAAFPASGSGVQVGSQLSPITLFVGAAKGIWLDYTDPSTMFQDTAGTIPVTTVGQSVARITDKSGLGFHATQATLAKRAKLGQDSDGTYHLVFTSGNYYTCGTAMNSAEFTMWVVFNATNDNTRLFDARGAGLSGTIRGFQVKGPNSVSDGLVLIDDAANHTIQYGQSYLPLASKQMHGFRYRAHELMAKYSGVNYGQQINAAMGSVTPTVTNTIGVAANDLATQAFVGKMYCHLGVGRCVNLREMNQMQDFLAHRTKF